MGGAGTALPFPDPVLLSFSRSRGVAGLSCSLNSWRSAIPGFKFSVNPEPTPNFPPLSILPFVGGKTPVITGKF